MSWSSISHRGMDRSVWLVPAHAKSSHSCPGRIACPLLRTSRVNLTLAGAAASRRMRGSVSSGSAHPLGTNCRRGPRPSGDARFRRQCRSPIRQLEFIPSWGAGEPCARGAPARRRRDHCKPPLRPACEDHAIATIDEALDEFLAAQKARLAPSTYARYADIVSLLRDHLNGYAYQALNQAEQHGYIDAETAATWEQASDAGARVASARASWSPCRLPSAVRRRRSPCGP
jgi:hypothetical protein